MTSCGCLMGSGLKIIFSQKVHVYVFEIFIQFTIYFAFLNNIYLLSY